MIQADGLVKIYKSKQTEVLALQGLDLTVEKGELTALIGNSGSGKSTFLNMIGGLDRPSAGSLLVDGKNLFTMGERELVLRMGKANKKTILVEADKNVPIQTVVDVFDIAKKLGAAKLGIGVLSKN